ncbi:MAG TPA: LysR family transcriptional regulator [Burkholderiaceae bacterium]|nr:LysR family transcriptional regulator [Burkholderiaceae bacterium]
MRQIGYNERMNNVDYLDLDGRLLRLLIAVHEEGSVTRAAQRLGITQSAVSHMLDKLRGIVGDPLFVKSGRSVVATAQADELAAQARVLLDQLQQFSSKPDFNPASLDRTLTIAANDLQRDLLLPALFALLKHEAPQLRLRVIPSNIPGSELLRTDRCQLVISPRPPAGSDIVQRRLFNDRYVVFYDPQVRQAPRDLQDYLAAEHVTVVYEPQRHLDIDDYLKGKGIERRFAVCVAGFAGIEPFLKGTSYLATLPHRLGASQLAGFAQTGTPFTCPEMPMYAIWHQRYQQHPMMRWLLDKLYQVSAAIEAGL